MIREFLNQLVLSVVLALICNLTWGTTIIPFQNVGDLAFESDALVLAKVIRNYEHLEGDTKLFRYRLKVLETLKGDLSVGDQFDVQKWERVIGETWRTMWGDIELYEGSTYVLFLEDKGAGLYHPICFSYYTFEEISKAGKSYLVPSEHAKEFHLEKGDGAEPLYVYDKRGMLQELGAVLRGVKAWSSHEIRTQLSLEDFYPERHHRAAPSHCTYLSSGGSGFRWIDFETQPVTVSYVSSGASGCSSANTYAQACVDVLNTNYTGLDLLDGGTIPSPASCGDGSAIGSDFRTWVSTNLGGNRHIVIQYDDPCSEISDLSGCSGTLAIGGLYGIGTHTYDGETWFTGAYGYVIVNNGVGGCYCSSANFGSMLEHELTHAVGLGHISSLHGSANMNPSCCKEITTLDQACADYAYVSSEAILPVDLISFTAEVSSFVNTIQWKTAWESDVEKYILERADFGDAESFTAIAEIYSKGDTEFGHEYSFTDRSASDYSYYRLKSMDYSGEFSFSEIVTLQRETMDEPIVFPTATSELLHVRLPGLPQDASYQIIDATGQRLQGNQLKGFLTTLDISKLNAGIYQIQIRDQDASRTFKFFKNN